MSDFTVSLHITSEKTEEALFALQPVINAIVNEALANGFPQERLPEGLGAFAAACIVEAGRIQQFNDRKEAQREP